jgi:hypothetical protein
MDLAEARRRRDNADGRHADAGSRASEARLRRGIREAFARQRAGHLAEEERADRLHVVEPADDERDPPDER